MDNNESNFIINNLNNKIIAEIIICGAIHINITEMMGWKRPTEEQIKNLHDTFCIDVILHDE